MYSFATVDQNGVMTRVIQTTDMWSAPEKTTTIYYVNFEGYVEFDGSAHIVSSSWLADCIGRWTTHGDIITKW